jgi:hypothetical protein
MAHGERRSTCSQYSTRCLVARARNQTVVAKWWSMVRGVVLSNADADDESLLSSPKITAQGSHV